MVGLADRVTAILAGLLLAALLLVVSLGVVTRGLNDPFAWTDEASRFLMIWLACTGWALAGRKRAHIRIRFFMSLLPLRMQRAAETAMQAAVVLFGGLVALWAVDLVRRNAALEATTLPISMALMYVPVVLVGIATALQGASELVESLRGR